MADTDFNEWADFGFGPRITKDNYYIRLIGDLDVEFCNELFGFKGDITKWDKVNCISYYNSSFIRFQEWCRVIYDEMKDNQDKSYFFFRDLLNEFQLSKKILSMIRRIKSIMC